MLLLLLLSHAVFVSGDTVLNLGINKTPQISTSQVFCSSMLRPHFHLIPISNFACERIVSNQCAKALRCTNVRLRAGNSEFACGMRNLKGIGNGSLVFPFQDYPVHSRSGKVFPFANLGIWPGT